MFEHLKDINALLNQRISTMYKNIKSGSTSYYDSLGDFIDNYLKAIASKEGFEIDKNMSSGKILTDTDTKSFLLDKVGIDKQNDYDELRSIVRFINEHKHDNEKSLTSSNDILKTLEPVFIIYCKVAKYYNPNAVDVFDKQFIMDIYKGFEKEYNSLFNQINQLKEDLIREKGLSDMQKSIINKIETSTYDFVDDEVLKNLTETLVELKDVKIEMLIKKIDDMTDLLIEQKANIRENRIISFATLSSIYGPTGSGFDKHIRNAIEVIENIGFENHIEKNRKLVEDEKKRKEQNLLITKKVIDYLNKYVMEIPKIAISNVVQSVNYTIDSPNVQLLFNYVTEKFTELFGNFDYTISTDPTKQRALTGFPLTDINKEATLLITSNDLSLNKVILRFKLI